MPASILSAVKAHLTPALLHLALQIEAASEDLQGKPEQIIEKIVSGRVEKAMKAKLLLEQPYIRDTNMSVEELVKSYIAKLGENIQIARFVRFNVGELQSADPEA